jgi:hypothetical protein
LRHELASGPQNILWINTGTVATCRPFSELPPFKRGGKVWEHDKRTDCGGRKLTHS